MYDTNEKWNIFIKKIITKNETDDSILMIKNMVLKSQILLKSLFNHFLLILGHH